MTLATSTVDDTASALAEKLRPLFDDPGVTQLLAAQPNIWAIVEYGNVSYETRYSRMLRWLLDPAENHGLRGRFAKLLLEAAGAPFSAEPTPAHTRTSADSGNVHRLLSNVDVFLACTDPAQPFTLTIENKIFSEEHSAQLTRYAAAVATAFGEIPDRAFIFLTPDGRKPADKANHDEWHALSYTALRDVLAELIHDLPAHSRTRYLIEDFSDDIRQKFDTDFNERVVHPLALPRADGGFGEDLADLAAHTRGVTETTDDLIEDQGLSGDAQRGSALYDALRNLLVAPADLPADAAAGVSEHAFDGLLHIVTDETRLRQAGSQDHSTNAAVQAVITRVFQAVADPNGRINDGVAFGEPRSVCVVSDPELTKLGITSIRRTQGKGQGLYLSFTATTDSVASVYISGDVHSTMPNDPVYFTKDPLGRSKNDEPGVKISPRHLTASADASALQADLASHARNDAWEGRTPEERAAWLLEWTRRFARLAHAQAAIPDAE